MSDKNIEVLQTHLDHWKRLLAEGICEKTEGEDTIEAFQAAIEALKEPCEQIKWKRDTALAQLKELSEYTRLGFETAMEVVKSLPPVTPKPKTGKIIMGGYDCDHYICSECGHDFGWFSKPDYKYCPNCGAKMKGEYE